MVEQHLRADQIVEQPHKDSYIRPIKKKFLKMVPVVGKQHYLREGSRRPDVHSTTANRALKLFSHKRSWNSTHRRMNGLPGSSLRAGL